MNVLKVRWNWCWRPLSWRLGFKTAGYWDKGPGDLVGYNCIMAAFCFGPLEWQVTSPEKKESE